MKVEWSAVGDTGLLALTKQIEVIMQIIRTINAYLILPVLLITGFRFSKNYRWETNLYYATVYKLIDTVLANTKAGIKY